MAAAAVALVATVAPAATVQIDFDKDVDWTRYHTFSITFHEAQMTLAKKAPEIHDQIVADLRERLTDGGWKEATSDPDVNVTYHVTTQEGERIRTTSFGYGMGAGWNAGYRWDGTGWGTSNAAANKFTEGTLVIDAYDARENKLIWRGSATDVVPDKPRKRSKKVAKWIDQLARKWEKMRAE
jgi:hypothetical protein